MTDELSRFERPATDKMKKDALRVVGVLMNRRALNPEEGWVTGEEIRAKLGIKGDGSTVRHLVAYLRDCGHLVISGHRGYRLADAKDGPLAEAMLETIRAKAFRLCITYRRLKQQIESRYGALDDHLFPEHANMVRACDVNFPSFYAYLEPREPNNGSAESLSDE